MGEGNTETERLGEHMDRENIMWRQTKQRKEKKEFGKGEGDSRGEGRAGVQQRKICLTVRAC